MAGTVTAVIRSENRRLKGLARGDAAVHKELCAELEKDAAKARQERREFREHMEMKKEKERVKQELKEAAETHLSRRASGALVPLLPEP